MTSATLIFQQKRYRIIRFSGYEAINRLSRFTVFVKLPHHMLNHHWRHQTATLEWQQKTKLQRWSLVIGSLTPLPQPPPDGVCVRLQLTTSLSLARQHYGPKIVCGQSIPETIAQVLQQKHYPKIKIHWHLTKTYPPLPYCMQPPGESDHHYCTRLLAMAGIHTKIEANAPNTLHGYDNIQDFPALTDESTLIPRLTHLKKSYNTAIPTILSACSQIIGWKVGAHFKLSDPTLPACYHDRYLITSLHYHFEKTPQQTVMQQIKAIPLINALQPRYWIKPTLATTMKMQTREYSNNSPLNESGDVAVECDFEQTTQPQKLAPIPRIHLLAAAPTQQPQGWHSPWQVGTEVIVSFINNDPNRAIILGNVSTANTSTAYFATPSRLGLIMQSEPSILQLHTADQAQCLRLQNTNTSSLAILAKQGNVEWQTRGALSWICKRNWEEQAHRLHCFAQQNYELQCANTLRHQSHNLHFKAKEKIEINIADQFKLGSQNILLNAADELIIQSKQAKGLQVTAQNKIINHSHTLKISNHTTGCITLQCANQHIKIYAHKIEVVASQISFKGHLLET